MQGSSPYFSCQRHFPSPGLDPRSNIKLPQKHVTKYGGINARLLEQKWTLAMEA
jgi:hypothetical protein